jgi:hypothetical protein
MTKNIWFGGYKNAPVTKTHVFFRKTEKNYGLNKLFGHMSAFSWWCQWFLWAWRHWGHLDTLSWASGGPGDPVYQLKQVPEASSSCQPLILTFVAIKSFLMPS